MGKYIQTRFLGSGTYSEVYEATDIYTNRRVAIKKCKLSTEEGIPATSIKEIALLRSLQHPQIIHLIEVINTTSHIILVFEYLDFDLKTFLSKFQVNIIPLVEQFIMGLHVLHSHKIVHRDLKPQNILVSRRGALKIADFGLARTLSVRMPCYSNYVVTLWYRSPELLKGDMNYSFYIDMWSVGCIIVEMITGRPLFPGKDERNQMFLIKSAFQRDIRYFVYERVGNIPGFLMDMILGCLQLDVSIRYDTDKCLELMKLKY